MYPLKFEPILKTIVWGGEKIAPFKGIKTEQKNIGESWELSGVKGNESIISNGEFKGRSIPSLIEEFKGELVGNKIYQEHGNQFPLLIKFIDALSDLSIQVHPDDELAGVRHNGSKGKTEMWYVVGTGDNAHLLTGLSENITKEDYVRMVEDGSITNVLTRYDVKKGDVFFLPAGRIHAICGGCFIAEIQQTSDITYRIFDYNRLGLDGKPREVHTELAKDAIDYTVYEDYRTDYSEKLNEENEVVSCKYFTTSIYDLDKAFSKDISDLDSFVVIMGIEGDGKLITIDNNAVEHETSIQQGETILVPANSKEINFIPNSGSKLKIITSHID